METTELIAVIFAILYVVLAAKESLYCWPAAIVSVSLYVYICFNAKLFPETGLQIFYLAMAIYGWLQWRKPKKEINIKSWPLRKHFIVLASSILLSIGLGYYFDVYTQAAMPYLDSSTTILSLFATYMLTKKIIENWWYWIAIDIASAYLYYNRDLTLSAILFALYVILASVGYLQWKKNMA